MADSTGNESTPDSAAGPSRTGGPSADGAPRWDPEGRTLPNLPTVYSGVPEERFEGRTHAVFPQGLTIGQGVSSEYPNGVIVERGARLPKALGDKLTALKDLERRQQGQGAKKPVVLGDGVSIGPGRLARARRAQQQDSSQRGVTDPRRGWAPGRDPRRPEGPKLG
ncbi:hypothetical protein [Streptomonospora nanhaiensis]|uniref:Uncharacterized protein n=1 Tax=Streptomonospora nanhaiensis TaxID=1323731 RepID=A0A853BQS2_9ACTN|nr:hypothetical protein [Streptomonospora nanhaiensis]MBV2364956.1 hypothetical protein [Streptomonospora nanhaiensis]NYI97523.1 hypothetical protein [Streptomonospora nanhaiensis]